MREILFRGQKFSKINEPYSNEWFEGYYYQIGSQHYIRKDIHIWHVDKKTVGQFTGLTDKVKARYFDGCIGEYFNCKFIVVWDNGWYAEFIETKKKRNLSDFCEESVHIGNIHDNPELIK